MNWLGELWRRLRMLVRRSQFDAGLEEEILERLVRGQGFHGLPPFFSCSGRCEYSRLGTCSSVHRATRSVSG